MEIVDIMKYMTITIRMWNLELFAIFPFIYSTLTSLGMPPCWCCRIQRKKLNQRREIGWITWYAIGTLSISFVWACKTITFIRRISFLHDMWCVHLFFTDTTRHTGLVSNAIQDCILFTCSHLMFPNSIATCCLSSYLVYECILMFLLPLSRSALAHMKCRKT